jgi:putative ABC transport system ATP-binding protein
MSAIHPGPALDAWTPSSAAMTLAARDVTRRFGEGDSAVDAFCGVSLTIPTGQYVAVMGPSGSGKSTLMHILAGLDRPTSGSVQVQGEEISELGDKELTLLRRRHIGFIFQSFNLLPMLTAEENVLLPSEIAGRKVERRWLDSVLERVGLTDRRTHRPAELSGGQQQRVAVARALVEQPTVLFADEPTGNLDSRTSVEVLALLRDAADAHGQTIAMVTHDPAAAATADRVLFLADGLLVHELDGDFEAADVASAMAEVQS